MGWRDELKLYIKENKENNYIINVSMQIDWMSKKLDEYERTIDRLETVLNELSDDINVCKKSYSKDCDRIHLKTLNTWLSLIRDALRGEE